MTTTFRAERALQKILGKANGAVLAQSLGYNDDMTAGTAVASKTLILDANKGIATITSATITTITNTTHNGQTIDLSAITSGATDNVKVGAFSSTADGSGSVISTTRTASARFYGDDGGVALGAAGSVPDLRNVLSRMLVTEDATANKIRLHSIMGQLKAYAATGDVGIWDNEQVAGVYGYMELVRASGTMTYGGYGVSAAVLGCIETSGVITVNTNHVFAGVASISKLTSDLVQTGKTCGFYAGIYDTTNWSDGTARAKWGYGLYVDEDAVSVCPIQVGKFVASAGTGGGFAVTLTNSAAARVYAEVTADLTSSAMVRSVLGRMLISGAITSTAEVFGVVGQLVTKAATIQHDNAGVLGTFEAQTTAVTVDGTGGDHCVAAVMGRVGVTITATTVNATGILSGVAAMSNITDGYVSVTAGGLLAGVYVGRFSSKQVWDHGIYVSPTAVKCALSIGQFASSYATGSGAVFSTSATTIARMYGETTSDLTNAYNCRVILGRHLVVTASGTINHETYGVTGQLCVKNSTMAHLHAGVTGTFEVNTACTVNPAYTYGAAGVMSRLGVGTSITTATKPIVGFAAVYNGGALASGASAAFAACSTTATNFTYFLAAANCDYVFYAETGTAYESGVKIASITNIGTAASGVLKVKVASTDYYIPLYAVAQLDGE